MKKLLIIVLLFAWSLPGMAQRGRGENVDREKLEAARVAFITNRLDLSPDQAEKFWPVYNQYNETKRKFMRELHSLSRVDEAELSDSKALELLDRNFKIQDEILATEKDFIKEVARILSPVHAFKLNGIHRDFTRHIYRMQRRGSGQKN